MFYWQTIGTAPWHPEQVAGTGHEFLGTMGRPDRGAGWQRVRVRERRGERG
jgi:hypothetical protein